LLLHNVLRLIVFTLFPIWEIIIRLPWWREQGNRMIISQIGNNVKTINLSTL
ncbi:MAG: hypothetical protein BECKG1743E_GA0114224_107363, partial [Candidatus Kentron sp. G]